jgi:hypothetical protein
MLVNQPAWRARSKTLMSWSAASHGRPSLKIVSEEDMRAEVGDPTTYVRRKLAEANRAERVRHK